MIDRNFNITFLNHASFLIEYKNIKILNDPYTSGSAFNNGWNLIIEAEHDRFLNDITHIFYSHEHPDHFSIPFLKSIPSQYREKITIIYQETFDKRVKYFCEDMGFKFLEIKNLKETKISENFFITIGKVPYYDSWINYKIENKNILNVNDCVLENSEVLFSIKKILKKTDILFTQFSYANYIPIDQQKKKASDCLKQIKLQDKTLKPEFIVPFASFIYFSHIENYFMNKNMNTIEFTNDYISQNCNANPIILKPNEKWDLKNKDNKDSLNFWNKYYKNIPNLKYNSNIPSISTKDLLKKGKNYIERINKYNNKFLIQILYKLNFFIDISIFVSDLNKYFNFNLINGLVEISSNKKSAPITMSSDSLGFIFDYDFGFDTLYVNARFKTTSSNIKKLTKNFMIGSLNNTGRFIKFNNFNKFLNIDLIKRTINFFRK